MAENHVSTTLGEPDARFAEYLEKRFLLRDNLTADPSSVNTMDWYEREAELYDTQVDKAGFQYIPAITNALETLLKNKDAKILDVAAGSGKVGLKLRECGYTNLDGLDGSSSMLAIAKAKCVYQKYICCMVGSEKIKAVPDFSYHAVCIGASFGRGHLGIDTIPTMLRAVKTDGHLIIERNRYWAQFDDFSDERLDLCLEELKRKDMCSSVEKEECTHRTGEPADLLILRRGPGQAD